MKKILTLLILSVSLVCKADNFTAVKISQFPLSPTVNSNWLFLIENPNIFNRAIPASFILDAIWSFSTNVSILQSNMSILQSNVTTISNTVFGTGGGAVSNLASRVAIDDGFIMQPLISGVSNVYVWDWGKTNGRGEKLIYASLLATNDVLFLGPTNLVQWRPFSYDVVASGGTRVVYISTNTTYLATNYGVNNLWKSNAYWALYLTNGSLFRMSLQSNIVVEPIWIIKGQ